MPNSFATLGVADYNQQFLDALEFVDDVIQRRQHLQTSTWRSMIARQPYVLGEGLVKRAYRFHPGLGDQRGLHRWHAIQISRVASGADPGVDACAYNPYLVDYGFETVEYTGFQTSRRTRHICIRDIRFTWQFKQQLNLVMGFLGDVTNSVHENFAREWYIRTAVEAGNAFVLSEGSPNSVTFTYDPFSTDDDGDNTLTIARGNDVSMMNWTYMRWFDRFLQVQAPQAAIGNDGGWPLFGLVFDMEDFDRLLERDPDIREDYRHAKAETLIEHYGKTNRFKAFSLMHDPLAPRFAIKSQDGTNITLRRVDPKQDDTAVTIGNRVGVNTDYLNAEYAMGIIFLKDVFSEQIPPAGPTNPGGGTSFGATPSLNGEFKWVNIPNEETNLLGENGFYFSRFEIFPKPGIYDQEAIVFLYRRVPNTEVLDGDIGGDAASVSPVTISSATAVAGSDTLCTIVCASIPDVETPDLVTCDYDGTDINNVVVADSSASPTLVVAFPTAANRTSFLAGTTLTLEW